jgi:signal transduction histidine kinase
LAALALASVVLAVLGVQAVRHEAQTRRRVAAETQLAIADLVSARLDAAMADADREAAAALQAAGSRVQSVLKTIEQLEISSPWLHPLVLTSAGRIQGDPETANRANPFGELLTSAERAEYRGENPKLAAELYAAAAAASTRPDERADALNRQARAELKARETDRALDTYRKLIAEAFTLDPEQARLAAIARYQITVHTRVAGKERESANAAVDLYAFLLAHRFVLGDGVYGLYRPLANEELAAAPAFDRDDKALLDRLRARERAMEPLGPSVRGLAAAPPGSPTLVAFPIGEQVDGSTPSARAVHIWDSDAVRLLLERTLAAPGPWSGARVTLLDGTNPALAAANPVPVDTAAAASPLVHAPGLRVAALPRSGSVSRDVAWFAALLALVFATVVAAMVLAARSVTRELALSRTRADFVASVSHELKTPLSLIRMFAESLREGWVAEDKRLEYYDVMTRESERLTGLIDNVLDFSRIESGTRRYQRATVDVREMLANLLNRYRYHLKAAGVELIETLPPASVLVAVDREAIEQAVVNLLSNAVKYMGGPDRQPREVRVSLTDDGTRIVIRVEDTGIGISPEHLGHIFERFWRADDERVRAVAGTGLGLTLVKHVVESHGGAIHVESVPDRGSAFALTLPGAAGGAS